MNTKIAAAEAFEERVQDFKALLLANAITSLSPKMVSLLDPEGGDFGKWLVEEGFFEAPASTKYHGNYPGGLYDHSATVTHRLIWMTHALNLTWSRPESPFIVGMFHDLCKIDAYEPTEPCDESLAPYKHRKNLMYSGHGSRSLALLASKIPLTEEEIACIVYHMGAYETEMWQGYDLAIRKFPNVLWTHTADMAASKIDEV